MNVFDAFPQSGTLRTLRLTIRPIEIDDLESIYAIKSDFEVTKRYGAEASSSLEQTRKWLHTVLPGDQNKTSTFWVISLEGSSCAIGSVCFWNFESEFRTAELGYELNRAYWHKGIMSEALPQVLKFGFMRAGFHRVEALPLAFNESSKNLLKGLGFKLEGTLRERILFRGSYYDQLFFSILRDEWTQRNKATLGINKK
jgi:[ribosomal protein S5]-alanine N-acetyltransferase